MHFGCGKKLRVGINWNENVYLIDKEEKKKKIKTNKSMQNFPFN